MIKRSLIVLLICSLILIVGCATPKDYDKFKETARQCVNEHKDSLLELFDVCKNNNVKRIEKLEDNGSTGKGTIYEYNGNKYSIYIYEDEDSLSDEVAELICKTINGIFNEYEVRSITCYTSMQLYFKEDFFNADWQLEYYPPDVKPPEDVDNDELYDELGDGFYTCLSLPG